MPAGDADALAAAIIQLYRMPSARAQMGAAARARMAADFEIGKIAARLEAAYQRALAQAATEGCGRNFEG